MQFTITTNKGDATFTSINDATEWLFGLQPMCHLMTCSGGSDDFTLDTDLRSLGETRHAILKALEACKAEARRADVAASGPGEWLS